MNPNSGENSPKFEFEPGAEGQERRQERAMETPKAQESAATKKQIKDDSADPTAISTATTSIATDPPATTLTPPLSTQTSDLPAHDTDLIEKQWVERAKTIVRQTQDDPYIQKKEISKAGADYVKKRFNKTIPIDGTANP